LNPENTVVAFKSVLELGADVIETDVRLTKDNHLVIFHDETVDRTTNSTGKVRTKTLQEMRQLDPGFRFTPDNGSTFPFREKGLHISTLTEVLDLFPNTMINVELKDEDKMAAEMLLKELQGRKGIEDYLVVCGRHCKNLLHFKKIAEASGIHVHISVCESEIAKYVLHDIVGTNYLWYSSVRPLQGDVFQIPVESGGIHFDDPDFVSGVKAFGKRLHYWVINNRDEIKRLVLLGADGIITDRVDIAVDVFHELGIIEKKIVDDNLPKNYFLPLINFQEVHTCVSLICLLTKLMLRRYVIYGVLAVTILIVYFLSKRKKKNKKD